MRIPRAFGQACWGYGVLHDGKRYEAHLCEPFATIAYLQQERRMANLFEDMPQPPDEDFGLVAKDDFFRDGP